MSGIAAAIVAQTVVRLWRAAGVAGFAEGVDTPMRLKHRNLYAMHSIAYGEYSQKFFRTFLPEAVTTTGWAPIGRVSLVAARTPERTATRPTHFFRVRER